MAHLHTLPLTTIAGKSTHLGQYAGKTLLIVNTASECGLTPQYTALEALYQKYKDRGLVILGFPSNDFGAQEPGTNSEIETFCQRDYGVTFPLFAKGPVKGPGKQPLYKILTDSAPAPGEIEWNFEKFLVDAHGKVVQRFKPTVTPDSQSIDDAISLLLG